MDRDALIAYLLHRLSEPARLELSERVVTDPSLHDALRAVEAELLDDYARGALAREEREAVEAYLLTSPLQQQKLAFATALRARLQPPPSAGWSRWALPMAAAVLLGLMGITAWLVRENQSLRTAVAALPAAAPVVATGTMAAVFVPAGTVRGGSAGPVVALTTGVEVLRLDLELEAGDETATYTAEIAAGAEVVWRGGPVRAIMRDGLFVAPLWVPAHVLAPGRFEVRLSAPAGPPLYYPLLIGQ